MIESLIVSAVLLTSLLLVLQMVRHFTLWWARQEGSHERTAAARYALYKINSLLQMTGYRPSDRGIHAMGPELLSVEYLVEEAQEEAGHSRHRLYTIHRDGPKLKLTTQRRCLPLDGSPAWGEGSTTVLAEGLRELTFTYFDSAGSVTDVPGEVRLVGFTLRLDDPGVGAATGGDHCYRSAVFLRNHHG